MKDFNFSLPTKIFFGESQSELFISEVLKHGKKFLLVTGGASVTSFGYVETVKKLLEGKNAEVYTFSGIEPNPFRKTINRAALEYMDKEIDAVIGLGGGSVMDAAKGIAALLSIKEEDIWPYCAGSAKFGALASALPIVCIPTTAATASEVSRYAVISDPELKAKLPLAYDAIRPAVSWINPIFTLSLTPKTTQDGAADILSHVLENYLIGGNSSPLADEITEGIVRQVFYTLPALLRDPQSYELRATMQWCSTLALSGLQLAGRIEAGFPLHAIEHQLSGYNHGIAHGRGLATLFPAYFKWLLQKKRAVDRLAALGKKVFFLSHHREEDLARDFIHKFEHWLSVNELLQSIPELGIQEADYPLIAKSITEYSGIHGILEACGPMHQEDILQLFYLTHDQHGAHHSKDQPLAANLTV